MNYPGYTSELHSLTKPNDQTYPEPNLAYAALGKTSRVDFLLEYLVPTVLQHQPCWPILPPSLLYIYTIPQSYIILSLYHLRGEEYHVCVVLSLYRNSNTSTELQVEKVREEGAGWLAASGQEGQRETCHSTVARLADWLWLVSCKNPRSGCWFFEES